MNVLMAIALAGCNSVFKTVALPDYHKESPKMNKGGKNNDKHKLARKRKPETCKSSTGAYYLPKSLITVRVDKKFAADTYTYDISHGYRKSDGEEETTGTDPNKKLAENLVRTVADRRHQYCLDYLSNIFAADHINIRRNNHQLLERVFSNVRDQSVTIAEKLIEAGGLLAASLGPGAGGRSTFDNATPENQTVRVAEFEFDPFEYGEITEVNNALRPFGYCVYLKRNRDKFVPTWMDEQCKGQPEHPSKTGKSYSGMSIVNDSKEVTKRLQNGILYKPLLTHTLIVMRKRDPESSLPWKIHSAQRVKMPNAAPPFMLEVKRAIFTDRKTDIKFKNGMLQEVFVDKKSEWEAFVRIPVRAIQVLVEIPVRALTLAQTQAENQQALVNVNQQMIETLEGFEEQQTTQSDLLAGLSPADQLNIANRGGVPGLRNSTGRSTSELSFEACLQNAVLQNPATAEDRCNEVLAN